MRIEFSPMVLDPVNGEFQTPTPGEAVCRVELRALCEDTPATSGCAGQGVHNHLAILYYTT